MAENKKSIIVYADWIHVFKELDDEEAGQLIKHFFSYVNDEDPIAPSKLIKIAFEPIKQTLKRDLENWNKFREKQSENGKKGGRPTITKPLEENPNNPSLLEESQKSLSVSVSDSVNVNDSEINIKANAFVNYSSKDLFNYLQTDKNNIQAIERYWNLFAEKYNVPKISKINDKRRKKLKTRSKEELFDITKILAVAKDQKFLLENTWFTFDWMIESESNYVKVLEGNYKEKPKEDEKPKFTINGNE